MTEASVTAQLAFVCFVPASIIAFLFWRPPEAVAATFLGAALFLPERTRFDMPGLPPIDKVTLPVICVLFALLAFHRGKLSNLHLARGPEVLVVILMISAVGTALTNGDVLFYDTRRLASLGTWDIVSIIINDLLNIGLPFLFGILYYRSSQDLKDLYRVIVMFALIYSPLAIIEIALSPQFHQWIYGFHSQAFPAQFRFGGYRPRVFTGSNGLPLALFFCSATFAAVSLGRARMALFGVPSTAIGVYLGIVFLMCKSLAALAYFLVVFPIFLVFSWKIQLRTALLLAILVFSYPILRAVDWFPTNQVVELAATVNKVRADSLRFRFINEDALLKKAFKRPVFGWGGFKRNRIFRDGLDISTTDGFWIIFLGTHGAIGLIAVFGIILLPIALLTYNLRQTSPIEDRNFTATLALIAAIHAVDLLPNGMFTPLPLLFAGALLSMSRRARRIPGPARWKA